MTPSRRRRWHAFSACAALLLTSLAPDASTAAASKQAADQLSIQVNNDRMTLAITKVPQVYLYGLIDADAPQRFEALMKSWKIPTGSDIYLNSTGGDVHAGMALGRLIRSGAMVTHLGTPRRNGHDKNTAIKTAICAGACAYAYLGGVYRWAPTGSDRIGFPIVPVSDPKTGHVAAPEDASAYLKEMNVDAGAYASIAALVHDDAIWPTADQMMANGLANNGLQPLKATYRLGDEPYLTLDQAERRGEHRISFVCKRDGIVITSYDMVGSARASQVQARSARSYLKIGTNEILSQQFGGVDIDNDTVKIERVLPANQLAQLLDAHSVGAWVSERNNMFHFGFDIYIDQLRPVIRKYYDSCWQYAPWSKQVAPKT